MKKGQKFLISLGFAALTYGGLFAAFGPSHTLRHQWKQDWQANHPHHGCGMQENTCH